MPELIANGLYTLTIRSVGPLHDALDDDNVYVLELDGAPKPCCLYAANNEMSRRVLWGDIVEDWYDMPSAVGRTFIFPITQTQAGERVIVNQVHAPLIELVTDPMSVEELAVLRFLLGKFLEYLPTILSGDELEHELLDCTNLTYSFVNSIVKNEQASTGS